MAPVRSLAESTAEVRIQDYQFQPKVVEIQEGDFVRWVNHEKRTSHSVVLPPALGSESERIFPGEHWQRQFESAGRFPYQCGPHPEMTGVVVVNARDANATQPPAARAPWPKVMLLSSEVPPALLVVNEQRQTVKSLPLVGADGTLASGVLGIYTAVERNSFIVGFKNMAELWEISFDPGAPDIGLGLVHDFQYREGHFVPGYLNPKRTTLLCEALAMALSPAGHEVLTLQACPPTTRTSAMVRLQVFHLDVRKPTSQTTLPCMPTPNETTLPWPEAPLLPQLTGDRLAEWNCQSR